MQLKFALAAFAASAMANPQVPFNSSLVPVIPTGATGISSGFPIASGNSSQFTSSFRVSTPTLRATTTSGGFGLSSSAVSTAASTSSSIHNAASAPTAAMGLGLAGIAGLVGVLAL